MISDALDTSLLQQWIGSTETASARIDARTAAALAATLDRDFSFSSGTALPPLWHWIFFWTAAAQSELGADGHPQRGGFLPPVPLPRRMWAGGRLTFSAPLPVDAEATRTSVVKSVVAKTGVTGNLAFVTVKHEIAHNETVCVTEEHDIVYRAMPQPGAPTPVAKPAPSDPAWRRLVTPDPVLLFRYSALTFNGHRIHYDRSYVTAVEGYPGLIVHGPLIATLLADLLQRHLPEARMTSFSFRAVGTLFDTEPFTLCGQPDDDGLKVSLWAQNMRGELAMQAEAILAGMKNRFNFTKEIMLTRQNSYEDIRDAVRDLCAEFPGEYFRKIDEARAYPEQFVDALTKAGWLAALIPQEYGGSGLGLTEASVIMEEINRAGGNSGACHGQMYNMGTLLRHGSKAQKEFYLPKIASGELRLQSMAVTEPTTGTDTTRITTTAVRKGDKYVINGQKVWISRVQHSDLMILLARTTPLAEVNKKSEGMSIFLVDLRDAIGNGLSVQPILNMVNHETNELFFENLEIPVENLIGEEGKGFKYILDGLNAERTLIAAECIGDGYWFIDKVTKYVNERIVFGRPIGQNQGVQFPIAKAFVNLEAANLMRYKACELFDAHQPCGTEANMAKMLAADVSWEAANACLQFHGGFGFACEYDVERKFRETRLYQVAPISTNLILSYVAEHVLGLPRSF